MGEPLPDIERLEVADLKQLLSMALAEIGALRSENAEVDPVLWTATGPS
jgi:hypothetical protein